MPEPELNEVQQEIEDYLAEQVADGQEYFKSSYIADDLDRSAKCIGSNLSRLQGNSDRVTIKNWSNGSSGITWLVSPTDPTSNDTSTTQPAPVSTD